MVFCVLGGGGVEYDFRADRGRNVLNRTTVGFVVRESALLGPSTNARSSRKAFKSTDGFIALPAATL